MARLDIEVDETLDITVHSCDAFMINDISKRFNTVLHIIKKNDRNFGDYEPKSDLVWTIIRIGNISITFIK